MAATVIGWDIGGAHLKAARLDAGRVGAVVQVACPLWQGLDKLETAFEEILATIGPGDVHAVTMTGELVDLFDGRAAGVAALTDAATRRLGPLAVYAGAAGFLEPDVAVARADDVASANWHATASHAAVALGDGLLLDIGSTTADVVPFRAGAVAARGTTDAARMAAGELVYTGATRTALMAVASRAPVAGVWTGVMAEYFATMADANRLLGRLGPDDDRHPTADGRDRGVAASRLRLSRMVGRDVDELSEPAWQGLAAWFAESQIRAVHDAALLALSAADLPAGAPVVACGVGRVAVGEVARRLARPVVGFEDLVPLASHGGLDLKARVAACAPAVATALLRAGGPSAL